MVYPAGAADMVQLEAEENGRLARLDDVPLGGLCCALWSLYCRPKLQYSDSDTTADLLCTLTGQLVSDSHL